MNNYVIYTLFPKNHHPSESKLIFLGTTIIFIKYLKNLIQILHIILVIVQLNCCDQKIPSTVT